MLSGPQQKFCEGIVAKMTRTAAYQAAYPKSTAAAARKHAARLVSIGGIRKEIARLRAKVEKVVVKEFAWTELDGLNWAKRVLDTPIGEVGKHHDLCQEYAYSTSEHGGSERFKMPAKMDAFEKIAKMRGWYAPEKVEHSGTVTVMDKLAALRSKKYVRKAP